MHAFDLAAVSVIQPAWIQEVLNSYVVDPFSQQLLQELAVTGTNDHGFSLSLSLSLSLMACSTKMARYGLVPMWVCKPKLLLHSILLLWVATLACKELIRD
jgi:hypothetical protein